MLPERDAQELLVEMADLTKGYKAQSESAKTRVSRMESLLMQVGKESLAMRQGAEEEKQLMRRENQLLKKTLGLVQTHHRPQGQSARGSAEGGSGRDADPEARSRPGSARRKS